MHQHHSRWIQVKPVFFLPPFNSLGQLSGTMWAPSPWDEGAPGGEELNKGEEAWMDYFLDAELSPQDSPPSGRAAKQAKQHGGETPGSGGAAPA